jgi:hypothetical protein
MYDSSPIELKDLDESERTRCEVWTRVMGYHRPVSAFNRGKRAEHGERCYFTESPRGTAMRVEHQAAA